LILLLLALLDWGPTTDGKIAIGNLDAQIAGLLRAGHHAEAVGPYLIRAQFLSAPGDYDQAEELAEMLLKRSPQKAQALLRRAEVRAALHEFTRALADARQAEKLDASLDIEALRAGVWQATGEEEKALPFRRRAAEKRRDLESLGQLASLEGQLGHADEAERLFAEAQAAHHDVEPFGPAWLELQWGLLEERRGLGLAALEHFQAAHRLLPDYAPATGHLAAALAARGDRLQAIRLLTPLADRLEDPEYAAQLLTLQPDDQLRSRTAKRYDELLRKHPEAYADHAARFLLGQPRALELARQNLANRHNDEAYQLLISALMALKRDACAVADDAFQRRAHPGAPLRVAVAQAWSRCGKLSQAELLLKEPSPPPATPRR
jgi:hypothetical protein